MDAHHLLSACYAIAIQVVVVLVVYNTRSPTCPLSSTIPSTTLVISAEDGRQQNSSVWYYEHVFDHQPARLRVLTEKEGAAPLRSNIPRKKRDITIVSGTTRDRLAAVESTAMSWTGAMCIAVHVQDEADLPTVYQQVQQLHARVEGNGRCRLDIVIVKEDDGAEGYSKNMYPVNGMRNIAWRMATTKLIILLDADFQPSPRMHEILTEGEAVYQELERKAIQEQLLFVIPAFEFMPRYRSMLKLNAIESQPNISIPKTKEELRKNWDDDVVDCFHCSFSPAGHEPTNFRKFFDPSTTTPYSISYVEGFEPYLLVAREFTPMYDERFRGYGKNKISHVYSCTRGHGMNLQVLPNAFVFEIPHPRSHSRTHWEGEAVARVTGLYRRFKKEVELLKRGRERDRQSERNEVLA